MADDRDRILENLQPALEDQAPREQRQLLDRGPERPRPSLGLSEGQRHPEPQEAF